MTKAKRSNETLSKAVRKCQASVTIQASTGLRKHALSPLEEQLKQQAFLNDSNRWSRTSNLSVDEKSDTAFYVRLLQRQTTHSKKGKRVSSAKFDTRLAAENHAYSFRYSKESRNCQIRLDAYVASQKLMFTVCDEEDAAASSPPLHTLNEPTNEISTDEPSKKKRKTSTIKKRSNGMTSNYIYSDKERIGTSRNPNNSLATWERVLVGIVETHQAKKIQKWLQQERTVRRAEKAWKKAGDSQKYRLSLVRHLTKSITKKNGAELQGIMARRKEPLR